MFNLETGEFIIAKPPPTNGGIVHTLDNTMPPERSAVGNKEESQHGPQHGPPHEPQHGPHHELHNSLKDVEDIIERMSVNGRAITITFREDIIIKYKEKYLMIDLYNLLGKTRCVLKYILVADWSVSGRFHLHGTIQVTDITKITNIRRKLNRYGMTKIGPINNTLIWADYCVKQYKKEGKHGVFVDETRLMYIYKP